MKLLYPDFAVADELDRAFAHIVRAISARRADFMFGAGMSYDSDVPMGTKLAELLLRLFFPADGVDPAPDGRVRELAQSIPFEALVGAVQAGLGKVDDRRILTDQLKQILTNPAYKLSQAHHDLLTICFWNGSRPTVNRLFTTNFDNLLDLAFGSSGVRITERNTAQLQDAQRNGLVPIFYLHGVLKEDYQITERDIFDPSFKTLSSNFRSALNEADAFVFVGYSMSDPDFRQTYSHFRDDIEVRRKYTDRFTYVVAPAADRFEYHLGRKLWESRSCVWIPLSAASFFGHVKELLRKHADKTVQDAVMKKFGLRSVEEFRDKVKQTAEVLNIGDEDAVQFLVEALTKTGKPS